MSLSVGRALREGLGRTFERNGLQLIGVFVVVRVIAVVADDTLTRANLAVADELGAFPAGFEPAGLPGLGETPTPYALALGLTGALVLALVVALIAEAVRIVSVRTLVSDRTDAVPAEFATRNIGLATVNGFVGGIVVLTLTVLGLIALVVPGVFLALSFFFVRQEIAVRDVNFVDAMEGSWALASGNRIELLLLAVALVVAGLVAAVPGAAIGAIAPAAGTAVNVVARAVVIVFGIASAARAYDQLRREADEAGDDADGGEDASGDGAGGDDAETTSDGPDAEPDYEGALTADDLPPPDERG